MSLRSQQTMNQRLGQPGLSASPADTGFSGPGAFSKSAPSQSSSASFSQSQVQGQPNSAGPGAPNSSGASTGSTYAKPAPVSPEQSRQIARTHFDALRRWLIRENALLNATASRNTAREKLTRLTRQQFQELSTDVYDELVRRIDDASGKPEPFLPVRNDFHPKRNQARQKLATLPLQRFRDLASDVYFELERRYPEFAEEVTLAEQHDDEPESYSPAPSPLTNNGASLSGRSNSDTAGSRRIPTPTGVGNDVVVPNKSTLVMEDSGPSNGGGSGGDYANKKESVGSESAYGGTKTNSFGVDRDREYEELQSGAGANGGPRNPASRASETSSIGTRFIGNYAGSTQASETGGRRSWEYEEREKVKAEYEYKITMLQNRVADLQRENDSSTLKGREADPSRVRELESQVRMHRDRYEDQSSILQQVRSDLEALQSSRSRDASSPEATARLRSDVERLTRERTDADDLANELRGEVSSLVDELRSVNARYEELMEAREKDMRDRVELEEEVRSWRKKYEQAKTELRNVRATSQIFSASIKIDGDHMPASADGLISDVNVTAFQSSIDDLLQAGRAKETSSVLPAMRAVVSAVDKIDRDVQDVDNRRLLTLPLADQERLQSLKANINATLSNLVTASRNHATSFGVSPVSLLDAAASHLSSSVIDLVRILKIRRSGPSSAAQPPESIREEPSEERPPVLPNKSNGYGDNTRSSSLGSASNSKEYKPPTRTGSSSQRDFNLRDEEHYPRSGSFGSQSPSYVDNRYGQVNPPAPDRSPYDDRYQSNEPQSMYGGSSYASPEPQEEQHSSEGWNQLKTYLEDQTEAIVHSIQSLLSAIRGGAQAEQLNENLTRIITIVSSIVAISRDALPDESRAEGLEILQDLTDHCDKLSGMSQQSSSSVFDKQTKQAMASASFGVAKSLKALNALLDSHHETLM